jgi:hypothetical protein
MACRFFGCQCAGDVMPAFPRLGPIPVWPYFFLATASAVVAAILLVVWWPSDYPDESALVKLSGDIESVVVRDDISKTSAGAILPAITSVYFRLKGTPGEFQYPSTHPKYPLVRDYTAAAVDIWVVKSEIGADTPVTIWQIQERNPRDAASELTQVSHAEIVERLTTANRSVAELGYWLLAASGGFVLIGIAVRMWNRDRPRRLGSM